jgi:DNA repair protein RecO (recombination protein O)
VQRKAKMSAPELFLSEQTIFIVLLQGSIYMGASIFKTKGIVLRTVTYGETSLIVSIFTERFGIQSYLVNGVRTAAKKGKGGANLFQPAALLDMEVYHQDRKSLQRIKEFHWNRQHEGVFSDITKNAVSLYLVELLTKCLRQPEENVPLFEFTEDTFMALDRATPLVQANLPLFFSLQLTHFFGVLPRILDEQTSTEGHSLYFDLVDSVFSYSEPRHPQYVSGVLALTLAELLQVRQPEELEQFALNRDLRRQLLLVMERYYQQHIQDFGMLKTLPVLKEILS